MKKRSRQIFTAGVGLGLVGAGIVVGRAWAVGIPSTKPLVYSGLLQNADGSPSTGSEQALEIKLWNDATATATTNLLCDTGSQTVSTDTTGRFSVPLGDDCTQGVAKNKDVYVEILLNGTVVGGKRSRLGAVPYAVEASHAVNADKAIQAGSASDSLGLHIVSDLDAQGFISTYNASHQRFSYLFFDKGRGTGASPASVLKGDELSRIYARAYVAGALRDTTIISSQVDGDPGESFAPGAISFQTSDGKTGPRERLRVRSDGRILSHNGMYVNMPAASVDFGYQVVGSGGQWVGLAAGLGQGSWSPLTQSGDSAILFSGGAVNSGGLVLGPWSATGSGLRMDGTGHVGIGTQPSSTYVLELGSGTAHAQAFTPASDERLKTNIKTLPNALEGVVRLRGVRFDWKAGGAHSLGVLAQEVERVYPEIVVTDANGVKAVDYDKLAAVFIESTKTLKRENDALRAQNAVLDERLRRVEAIVAARRR